MYAVNVKTKLRISSKSLQSGKDVFYFYLENDKKVH